MSDVPSPQESADAWDSCRIGTKRLPGICDVDVDVGDDIEKKKPKGGAKATTTYQGPMPASVKITCTLEDWLPAVRAQDDFATAQEVLAWLRERRGQAFEIGHPMTDLFGVGEITIERIKGQKKGRTLTISIEATEFFKGEPSRSSGAVTKTPTSLDPRNQILGPDVLDVPATPVASGAANP